jgi:hypothetical protein
MNKYIKQYIISINNILHHVSIQHSDCTYLIGTFMAQTS